MRRALPSPILLLASLAVGACSSGATPTPSSSSAPSVAPTTAASRPASVARPSPDACAKDTLTLKTAGKLTIGTDNPAYPPYFQIPDGAATKPWELGDPTNGQGFEGAFAYALAEKLGFAKADVDLGRRPLRQLVRAGRQDVRHRHQPGLVRGGAGRRPPTCPTATTRSTSRSSP